MNAEESLALNSKANDPRYNSNSEVGLAILANEDRTREKIEMLTEDKDRDAGAAAAAVSSHQQRKNADRSKSKSENTKKSSAAADAYLQSMQQKKTQNDAKKKTQFLSSNGGNAAGAEAGGDDNEQPAFFTPRHAAPMPLDEQQQNNMFAPLNPFQGARFPRINPAAEDEERQQPLGRRSNDEEPDALFMPEGGFFGTKSPPAPGIVAANGTAPITIDNNITTASPARGGNTVSASEDEADENAEKGDLRQKMDNLGAAATNKPSGFVPVQMSTGGLASLPSLPALTSDRSPPPQKNFSRKRESDDDEDVDDKPPRKQPASSARSKEKDADHSAASSYYYYSTESESNAGGEADQYGVRQPKPLSHSRNSAGGSHRRHRRHHSSSSRRQVAEKKEPTYEDFQAEIQRKVKEEEETEKREMLMLFYEKEQYEGIKMTRKFTMQSDLNEMRWWYYKLIRDCRINDEVEHMKNNLVQGSRFLLFINSTVLNNPLNLRMNDFPKELSKKLNTEWDRHLRDYVKSKCGISGPKPNPIRNLAWSVVNTAINYHRNQLALEEQEEVKRKREFEKAQAAAGMPPLGAAAPSPMLPQQSAYRAFTQPGAPSPFFGAGFGGMPPIDNSAPLEEQYKQLEQWQLFQRQQFLQQQQQQQMQQQQQQMPVATPSSRPQMQQQPRTSPMYALPMQPPKQQQMQPQAQPQPQPQMQQPPKQLAPMLTPNTLSMSAAPRSPPPPTFSTQRDALRAAVTSNGAAGDLPSFMRPPQTRTAAAAVGQQQQQDFRLPMPVNNRLNSAFVAAPAIGETAQRQTIPMQQQQPLQQQKPPQPRNALAPPTVNARAAAPFMQSMPQLPQSPTSRTQPTMLSRADESRVMGVQLPQAPSPRMQPVDIDKLEQMQQQMYQQPAVDPGTVPFLFQPPKAVPPPAPPTQRTSPPSPIRTPAAMAAAASGTTATNTSRTTMIRASTPLPMLSRPMLPMQPRTASTNAQSAMQAQQQQQQQAPGQPPSAVSQQQQQQRLPPQSVAATAAVAQQRPVPPAPTTIRQPLPPPSSLSAIRQPLPPPPSLARKTATATGAGAATVARATAPIATATVTKQTAAANNQDAEETVTINSTAPKRADRHHQNNNVQLTLMDEQPRPAAATELVARREQEQEAVPQAEPSKPLDEMSYDEIMADLQRQYDEDDSEQEYDDLVAGQNGAPVMAEVQSNDKVSEVMGLMSDFVEKNPGAGRQPEKQSNLYDDLDTLLQASDADTESGMSSIADIGTIRSAKTVATTKTSTRRRPQRSSAAAPSSSTKSSTSRNNTLIEAAPTSAAVVVSTPKRAQTSTSGSDSDGSSGAGGSAVVATPSKKKKTGAGAASVVTPNKKKKDNDAIGVGGNVTIGPKGTMMFATSPKKLQPPRGAEK